MIYLHLHYFVEDVYVLTGPYREEGQYQAGGTFPARLSPPVLCSRFNILFFPGDPPQAAAWIGQCILYLLIMVFEKTVISLVLLIPGWTKVSSISLAVAVVVSFCQLCLIHDSHY